MCIVWSTVNVQTYIKLLGVRMIPCVYCAVFYDISIINCKLPTSNFR